MTLHGSRLNVVSSSTPSFAKKMRASEREGVAHRDRSSPNPPSSVFHNNLLNPSLVKAKVFYDSLPSSRLLKTSVLAMPFIDQLWYRILLKVSGSANHGEEGGGQTETYPGGKMGVVERTVKAGAWEHQEAADHGTGVELKIPTYLPRSHTSIHTTVRGRRCQYKFDDQDVLLNS